MKGRSRLPRSRTTRPLESLQRLSRTNPEDSATRLNEKVPLIIQQMKRLTGLVERLLDVSQLTEGRLPLVREAVEIGSLVREVAARYTERSQLIASPINLVLPDGVVGQWDRLRVDQIVTNLIDNALKYGRGKPVYCSVEQVGDKCVIRVRDEGIGIATNDHARVFARYERAAPLHHYGGLGLGLWITQQIVLSHGGRISVESTPGQGSTFIVELPLRPF